MKIQGLLAGAVMALSLVAGAANATTNLVTNGGFETGDFSGWSLSGNTGFTGVQGVFSGVAPTEGADQAFFGAVGSDGTLSQNIATVAGASYTFSFDLYNFGGTPASFDALFNGVSVLSYANPPAFGYSTNTFTVTATGAVTQVAFTIRQDPSYFLLDNVSVTGGVPEPASWALMITGFLGAGVALRGARRRTAAATA